MQAQSMSNHYSDSPQSTPNRSQPRSPVANKQDSSTPPSTVVSPVTSTSNYDPNDDFDIMLLHEDFPYLLSIAAKAKETRKNIAAYTESRPSFQQFLSKASLQPDEVLLAVERMQEALLQRPGNRETIPRGRYPITDSIMEDSMLLLQQEHECGEQWLQEQQQLGNQHDVSSKTKEEGTTNKRGRATGASKTSGKKEAIGIKYSKWQTDILMNWMIEHKEQPFPDQQAVEWLTVRTGLSNSQVVNWTTNVRKRNRKATCEEGKKPHHFIDFLFLAHDREIKARPPQPPVTTSQYGAPTYRKKATPSSVSQPKARPSSRMPPPPPPPPPSPHPLERYQQHQQSQYLGEEAAPVPDEFISNNTMFGSFEAVPITTTKPEDRFMSEFADCWLGDISGSGQARAAANIGPATTQANSDLLLNKDSCMPPASSGHDILPSVTNDSNDQTRAYPGSFQFKSMDEDELKQWVEEVGLGVPV
jgi:Homeobox KN domain